MILNVHVPGAPSHTVGDEIWHQSLADAITEEAETIANLAGCELLASRERRHRVELRERIVEEMTEALVRVGDSNRAPDGVRYSLSDEPELDLPAGEGRLDEVSITKPSPTVEEVLRFEDLPLGSSASRRAVVRWSDGSEGEAMRWFADEILSPVDHVGRQ